jgi:hypothetical protein
VCQEEEEEDFAVLQAEIAVQVEKKAKAAKLRWGKLRLTSMKHAGIHTNDLERTDDSFQLQKPLRAVGIKNLITDNSTMARKSNR